MTESKNIHSVEKSLLAPIADDLRLLIRFHDRELDADFIDGTRAGKFASLLSVSLESTIGRQAIDVIDTVLKSLPMPLNKTALDDLAAEYANIYLCHNYRIAPTGSVWLTEEKLERQEPMFDARSWYEKYGVKAPDWRIRSDDHLVHEIQFLATLCEMNTEQSIIDAVGFLDQCMLSWIPDFANAVSERAVQELYIASAVLTAAYLEELRDLLEVITGISRPIEEVVEPHEYKDETTTLYDIDRDRPFVPGQAESW